MTCCSPSEEYFQLSVSLYLHSVSLLFLIFDWPFQSCEKDYDTGVRIYIYFFLRKKRVIFSFIPLFKTFKRSIL